MQELIDFFTFVKKGDVAKVKNCIEHGYINPSILENRAIRVASQYGHLEMVQYLLSLPKSFGVVVSTKNNSALRMAVEEERENIVRYLLSLPPSFGVDVRAKNNLVVS